MFHQLGNGLRRIVIENDVLTVLFAAVREYRSVQQVVRSGSSQYHLPATDLPVFTRAEDGFHRRNTWYVNIGGDAEHGWNREFNNFNIIFKRAFNHQCIALTLNGTHCINHRKLQNFSDQQANLLGIKVAGTFTKDQ